MKTSELIFNLETLKPETVELKERFDESFQKLSCTCKVITFEEFIEMIDKEDTKRTLEDIIDLVRRVESI